jgi:hypothetical protein
MLAMMLNAAFWRPVRRAPDFNFLTDFGVPIIPWKPF